MKIIGIIGSNNFGKEGKDVGVEFLFQDERDKKYDIKNGCAYVWMGGELNGEVNYFHDGNMEDDKMFTYEEKTELYEYVKNNF